MCMEHVEGVLAQFDNIFHFVRSRRHFFFRRQMDFVGNGCEWMKWHGMRPGSSLRRCMELVEGVLAQFGDILHGLAKVDVYGLITATKRILSEIAANG